MALIKLQGLYAPVWVNPTYIASIAIGAYGSDVFMANDAVPILVKEKPEDILQKIQKYENLH